MHGLGFEEIRIGQTIQYGRNGLVYGLVGVVYSAMLYSQHKQKTFVRRYPTQHFHIFRLMLHRYKAL